MRNRIRIKLPGYITDIGSLKDAAKKAVFNASATDPDLIFMMPKDIFVQLVKPLYRRYKGATMGAYTIPFRLRGTGGGGFDFESNLSLQANVVFGFGKQDQAHSWLNASIGIDLTGVQLNTKNSDVTEARTASAFTASAGLLLKPAPFANIGVFLGTDLLGKNDSEINWAYNRKPWIGLGINISFNQIKSPGSQKPTEQED
ncbi:MAG TPA: hypothetical protein PK325_12265 [Cyclobacteriaceae bacterium]|nr:hypothetical protein [Cyclobacteriaceae bacterium]HMV08759.1 hypothetical protein [Cyclobacteriaceae bacterium]HMV90217.1 hypothetical protein [Cyclobacteriaceae bacterium]HMW99904.1 hypothetical protein [Cyclobacteriaceae bacterium]HMX49233.1 hypothetical protein [Cyclobacteriaceae bacterium]